MSTKKRIALYPGDGIGVEVIEQAVRVVEAALGEGHGTPDIGGTLGSAAMTDRVIERLDRG